ncbi:alkaline phosphatase D family protein [Joostella sp. CR20]|uniref:alkaline phosphatase D family protein n=1 Tax=Joostella sp. CR20 TaxID=2804312 RepID=UPI00313EDB72
MNRRAYLKTFSLGAILPAIGMSRPINTEVLNFFGEVTAVNFQSNWQYWYDMKWVGPEYWANRMQDWVIENGEVVCTAVGKDRNLNLLTIQKGKNTDDFQEDVQVKILSEDIKGDKDAYVGFKIGVKGQFDDYRSASVFGKGLAIGVTGDGHLMIGDEIFKTDLNGIPENFKLKLIAKYKNEAYSVKLIVFNNASEEIASAENTIPHTDINGNFALVVHSSNKKVEKKKVASFSNWKINSTGLLQNEEQLYGPICFAQYTLHGKKLKLTAQLTPFENVPNHKVLLQFKKDGVWQTSDSQTNKNAGRANNFVVENWSETKDIPYRVLVELPLKNETHQYFYDGTIAVEPINEDEVTAGVFSCNFHYGFPDQDVCDNVAYLNPDIILFLGDQFYEGTGGYGVMYDGDFDELCIEYIRKWVLFGWSYRELFRHKPCAIIPDDHDVYHGNIWGEGGEVADTSGGYGASAQDSGGYKMSPEWVNMVQFTQTSHLPDPYDDRPVKQGIGVYYTQWKYAGLSFAILEDRKFKSAPMHVLPKEADIWNGWIQNENFDVKKYRDLDAELLGERQEKFLEDWVQDWSENTTMKVVLSQTNLATVATLPKEAKTDAVVPKLNIPQKEEYVLGDAMTTDMDSNGWPANKRDKAVGIIRKAFAFHIAGDQHMASFVKYGLEEFGDSGYAFAGPALNNIWPRRFWPPVNASAIEKHSYDNPVFLGDHIDGFGNKISVYGAGNPYQTNLEPSVLYNRATGYGLVTFNKKDRSIKTECWPRFVDVKTNREEQYPGWPITVQQYDCYSKSEEYFLPEIKITSFEEIPLVKLYSADELVYAYRPNSAKFSLKTFKKGMHTVELYFEVENKTIKHQFKALKENKKSVKV